MNNRRTMSQILRKDTTAGIILIVCAAMALLLSNSAFGDAYQSLWNYPIAHLSLRHWLNDGLMTFFFLLVGLELKREIQYGELHSPKQALLPVLAAIGGMAFPIIIYLLINRNSDTISGFGIAMSTDIAFVICILALINRWVPKSLKLFLVALSVIDDLGAVLVLTFFYVGGFNIGYFIFTLLVWGIMFILNKLGCRRTWIFLLVGIPLWYFLMRSGIHAALAGILIAMTIPSSPEHARSLAYQLQHQLHSPVYLLILPLFVLANLAIPLQAQSLIDILYLPHTQGIIAGLGLGKPLGIFCGTWVAIRFFKSRLPQGMRPIHLLGGGLLGGVGFTMAIFITNLSFDDFTIVNNAKLAIVSISILCGLAGSLVLYLAHLKINKNITKNH